MTNRAGTPALPSDLIDIDALVKAYYDLTPDMSVPEQRVVFGTSGHRGSSLNAAFNEQRTLTAVTGCAGFPTQCSKVSGWSPRKNFLVLVQQRNLRPSCGPRRQLQRHPWW